MKVAVAVFAAMLAVAGLVVVLAWLAGVVGRPAARRPREHLSRGPSRLPSALARTPRRTWALAAAAAVSAIVVTAWTGWPVMAVVVPVAVFGLPKLLSSPRQDEIELLQSLDRWVRGMTATMATGKSITDALRLSARQAPPGLGEPLVLLLRRLDDRWTPAHALGALADELDSADADAVIASLILSVQRGGSGAVVTLTALADSIQERLKVLREIEAERAKPRVVVRQVTLITLVVLGGALLLGRSFFAPYGTPLGQTVLAVLLAAYVGSLAMLRRLTLPRRRGRILRSQA